MYWIIMLFDENTEGQIKSLWNELSNEKISFYGEKFQDARPHITLGSYKNLNKMEFIKDLEIFYDRKPRMNVTFNTVGSFLNYGTLFLQPTVTSELLQFHRLHHEGFIKYSDHANPLYLPGKWIPHCTLANKLEPDILSKAFQYCLEHSEKIAGEIVEIGLIEMSVGESKGSLDAPLVFSKKLI
ncbi:2'-5' RNA ligase family protein [Falsibacillus albus]|uniref:2'-5' RNA ligase family protein n=1 Tax=Falsibacillus albus TaxID=2478915 RepID=A0A3L7JTS5_9BACI|nr:2'-5' RNA ligase family protein [Falsibacillus albus]RLQ94277.1 2'-5' RNA ligase family protein [Falsibacillus albus]